MPNTFLCLQRIITYNFISILLYGLSYFDANFVTTIFSALIFQQYMLHISKCIQQNQNKIIKWTWLEFKGDIAYFASDAIVAPDGSSQMNKEAFVPKAYLAWFCQYPGSAVQELIINSVYLDWPVNSSVSSCKIT